MPVKGFTKSSGPSWPPKLLILGLLIPVVGTLRTLSRCHGMSAFGVLADIVELVGHVALDPNQTSASISCCGRDAGPAAAGTINQI